MRSTRKFSMLVLLPLLALGCSEGPVEPGAALSPITERLMEGAVELAIPIDDRAILADTSEGLLLLDPVVGEGAIVGDPGELGEVRSIARVEGATLIVAEAGVFVIGDDGLFASPIGESFGEGVLIRSIVATPRLGADERDLWILTDTELFLYRDSEARPVTVDGVSFEGAEIASAPIRRGRSVWVATEGRILELFMRDSELHAGVVQTELAVEQMAADGRGYLFMLAGGALHALRTDRRLVSYELPFAPTAIFSDSRGPDLWIAGDGELWHHADGVFRPVEGTPSDARFGAGPDGELLVATASGLDRLRARHAIALVGLEDGGQIADATEVEVSAEAVDALISVRATVDGTEVPVLEAPTRIVLDRETVGFGAHSLEVTAEYGDGTLPATLRLSFQVGVDATWSEHVQPIYAARCAGCHDVAGPSPTLLNTAELWRGSIDSIVDNVREGRMPLGMERLDEDTVALIEAWAASGFPE